MNEIERLRKSGGIPLFDIAHLDWNPSLPVLQAYASRVYTRLVECYKKLEISQEYPMTSHVLIAIGCHTGRDLAFSAGGGFTTCEAACTHGRGWELERLVKKIREHSEPFNFRLLTVGYTDTEDDQPYRLLDDVLDS